ncbi:CBS domain-containing protein [Pseudorhodoferax sp.]|uniref:CBS domain-containing protein n=1 Tax=Pseudorhodoferax sp. TaxID=1993553 RepID=UPI002DD61E24|nr:CBS domain-containing protein [Pseudorhodoferax sp.]
MQACDVMTPAVVSVRPDSLLREVLDILIARRISGVPVVDDQGQVLGFVGEGELVHRHEIGTETATDRRHWWQRLLQDDPAAADYVRAHGGHARDVMNRRVVCVAHDAPLARLAEIFEERRVRRVPVLQAGRMVGLVTRSDLMRALDQAIPACPASPPAPLDDAQIRARLLAELEQQSWWHGSWSEVSVEGGVVRFVGYVQQLSDKDAARVAAENIPGVRTVRDTRGLRSELQPLL